jgi:peptide/nickel transport system permease protein
VSLTWFARRLMLMVYTVILVSMLVFAITQILPADAAQSLLGENATPEIVAAR